jgi:hypothetical protein
MNQALYAHMNNKRKKKKRTEVVGCGYSSIVQHLHKALKKGPQKKKKEPSTEKGGGCSWELPQPFPPHFKVTGSL